MYAIGVKFYDRGMWSRQTYTYKSDVPYEIGELVTVPARDHYAVVKVTNCSDDYFNFDGNINYKHVIDRFNPRKKEKNMNTKFIDRMFRRVDNVVWDIMTGRVGFKNRDGIVTIELNDATDTEAPNAEVSINMFDDFGVTIPAFAQSVPVDTITLGDLIFGASGPLGWVVKKNEKSFKLMKPDGTRSDWTPPKVQMLGFDSGVMVLRNLMNMFPGGEADLGAFQGSMLPMLMLMGDDTSDLSDILPFMLMGQMNGGNGTQNNMFQTMMLMKMLGGKKFGGSKFFD